MTHFVNRSSAAYYGSRHFPQFMTLRMPGVWRVVEVQGKAPASLEYAKGKDFVAWTEVRYIDEGRSPGLQGVLIVSCFKHELPDDIPADLIVEPLTPELWDGSKGEASATGKVAAGGRAKSEVESPTKLVWQIADSMPGADRKDVIAACIEKGVNKSTAGTQYYRWAKARGA